MKKVTIYSRYLKRTFDFLVSIFALVLLFPIFLILAIIVRINLGTPVFFVQLRPGKNERIFKMIKFRTMTTATDKFGCLLPDSQRLTSFGRFLRSTSLDELPEILNVIRGEMSLVGPRPLLIEYLPLYNELQRKRHLVRPGITGLAQVNGRNSLSWEAKFKYDVEYVSKVSFLFDLKIICKTIFKVLRRTGISSETSSTMEPFSGETKEVNK